jgi:hypothetical protein
MPENWTQLESARHGILTPRCVGSRCARMFSRSPGFESEGRGLRKEMTNE